MFALPTAFRMVSLIALSVFLTVPTAVAQTGGSDRKRATPPNWQKLPEGVFFADPFAEGLRGPRPASLRTGTSGTGSSNTNDGVSGPSGLNGGTNRTPWSQLISAVTLEDEMKRIERLARSATASEGHFKGRGYPIVRQHLGVAAVLFAVIEQYDEPNVRWQQSANSMWPRLARAAANAKVGTVPAYRDAKLRHQELFDLIRGSRPEPLDPVELTWSDIADRNVMMTRLNWPLNKHSQNRSPTRRRSKAKRRRPSVKQNSSQQSAMCSYSLPWTKRTTMNTDSSQPR